MTQKPNPDRSNRQEGAWLTCSECGSRWPIVDGPVLGRAVQDKCRAITGDGTPLHRNEDGLFECLACGAKIDASGMASLIGETLENAIAYLQLAADNGGTIGLSAEEARAILDRLEHLSGFARAFHAEQDAYAKLVSQVDMEYDEMADLITDLVTAGQAMAEYIALDWEHDPENEPGFMPDARAVVAKAEQFVAYYHAHMK